MAFTHVSASSIKLFQTCQKRWYFKYILGHQEGSSPAMDLGSEVHSILEAQLKREVLPPSSFARDIAETGFHLLPDPRACTLKVEQSLDDYPLPGLPIPFKGFIDCVIETADGVEILDHKTTSHFKYAKTPVELSEDTQMIIYAKHLLHHYDQLLDITLSHIAYLTKEPLAKAQKSSITVSREHVDAVFNSILDTVNEMLRVCAEPLSSQERNEKQCYVYGKRCPFYADCFNTLSSPLVTEMSTTQMSVLEKLRRPRTAAAPAAPVAPAAPSAGSNLEIAESAPDTSLTSYLLSVPSTATTTLYVDCRPLSEGRLAHIEDVLELLCDRICAAENVASLEMISYGQGYAFLNLALKSFKATESAYVNSASPLYVRCQKALHSAFDAVVVATR